MTFSEFNRLLPAAAIAAMATLGSQTSAATIDYLVTATAADPSIGFQGSQGETETISVTDSTDLNDIAVSDVSVGGSFASADLDVDLRSGTVKFGSSARAGGQLPNTQNNRGLAETRTNWTITETFTGDVFGFVTFEVSIDGFLDIFQNEVSDEFSVLETNFILELKRGNADGSTTFQTVTDRAFASLPVNSQGSRFFDDTLRASIGLLPGQLLTMSFTGGVRSEAQTLSTEPVDIVSNFRNTAALSFSTTNDMILTASDSAFLAGDTPPAIPLPAGFPLLLAGLGTFFGLRFLRQRNEG